MYTLLAEGWHWNMKGRKRKESRVTVVNWEHLCPLPQAYLTLFDDTFESPSEEPTSAWFLVGRD